MIENVPASVVKAVSAAIKDITAAMHGGCYSPVGMDKTASMHLENFVMGIVAAHYPKTKSRWMNSTMDPTWMSSTASSEEIVDGKRLQDAFNKVYVNMAKKDRTILEGMNYSKFNGKPLSDLLRENKQLHDAYVGAPAAEPEAPTMPDLPETLGIPEHLEKTVSPKEEHEVKEKPEEIPAKQKLRKPAEVTKSTDEERIFSGNAEESPEIVPRK